MASRGKTRLATREARSPLSRLRLYALRWRYNTPLHQTWTFRWPTSQYTFYSFIPPRPIYFARRSACGARQTPTQRVHTQVMHDRTPLRVPPHPSPSCRAAYLVAYSDTLAPRPLYISRLFLLLTLARFS